MANACDPMSLTSAASVTPAQADTRLPLLAIAGPTASGKTALAIALAQRLDGEIVSADSMQIYAALSVGTARPDTDEMQGIPHHLMGFFPLTASYSVAQYVEDARLVIADVASRGKLPILCGGTGLYMTSLLEHVEFSGADGPSPMRETLHTRIREEGGAALLAELARIDPETASRLHANDHVRIVRALEVYYTTGITMAEQRQRSRQTPSPYRACVLRLDFHDRQRLYDRINCRADIMLRNGLLEEARRVLACPPAATVAQAIGYKEFAPYLAGEGTLEESMERLKQTTRRYAKRQCTWFRHMDGAQVLYVDDPEYTTVDALTKAALKRWRQFQAEQQAP